VIPKKVTGQRSAKGSFKSALKYVLSDNKDGTKRPTIVATNMFGRSVTALAIEFFEVRSNSNRVKDPVWHVSLSAAHGERFTDEEWGTIGMKLIDKVGARAKKNEVGISTQNNQFVIVRHHNEDYEHIHIILNRVNLDLLTCYCSWDKNDLHAAAAEIEIEYGLTRCDHGKAKRSGYQKKDRRDKSPRVVARLEKKEQKTGETDPKLAAYREMIEEQRQQKERQQLLEQLKQLLPEEPINSSGETEPVANTQVQPTLHQQVELPTAAIHLSGEQQRQVAQDNYLTLWLIFQQAKGLCQAKEIAPGSWVYEDKEYAFAYNSSKQLFSVGHIERGLLARYQSRKLLEVGKIEPEDIEAFAKYEQSRAQPLPSTSLPQRGKSQWELG
jgi:hypothetical protein